MSHSYQFQLTKALYDKEYAYRFWADYAHGNNTAQITADDYSQICNKWVNEIDKWEKWAQSIYSTDENDWYYSQEELDAFYENGMNEMNNNEFTTPGTLFSSEETTTYEHGDDTDWKHFGEAAGTGVGGAAFGAASATWNLYEIGATNAAKAAAQSTLTNAERELSAAKRVFDKATGDGIEAADKAVKNAGQRVEEAKEGVANAKKSASNTSVLIACGMALAGGILAEATKANYKEGYALEAAGNVLTDTQGVLENAQLEMIGAKEESDEAYEKADEVNAEKEEQIAEQTALYDTYKSIIENTQAKVASGVPLTEVERAIYASAVEGLNIAGLAIETLQLEANDEVAGLRAEASEKTDAFLNASEEIETAQGQIDYVSSFDKATRTGAIVSMAGDGLNAASGTAAAIRAGALGAANTLWGIGALYWAAAAAAAAGDAMSGMDLGRQTKSLEQANNAIDTREITEGKHSDTANILGQNSDLFVETIDAMTEIELVAPDGIETDITADEVLAQDDANLFAQNGQTRTDNSQNDNQNYHRYNTPQR